MKTALRELEIYIESEPLISDVCKRLLTNKINDLIEVERDQITYAWAAGHRIAVRNPKHEVSPEEYYDDQFE